jgi:ligand-binding sensor domain-containing protein
MKTDRLFSALVFLTLLFNICSAQNRQFQLQRVPLPFGFHTVIHAGMQDSEGYMWFGTDNGLYRYDGYHYTYYGDDPLNSNSLVSHHIETVYADRNGMIWVGTVNGLSRLDPVTGNFTHFFHEQNEYSLSDNEVKAIFEDHEGMIWVGTNKGLNRFDPRTKIIQRFLHSASDSTTISNDQIRVIYEDKQETLWVGTGSAFGENLEKPPFNGGLNRFDRKTGTFTRYLHDPANPQSLTDSRVRAIFEDSYGTFWIGTAGDGLHTMDRKKGTFERHTYDSAHPEKLSRPALKKLPSWVDDHITFITEDVTRTVWIGTFGNGINRYDRVTKKVTHFSNAKEEIGNVKIDAPWWACTSKDGVLWIGYWENVYTIDLLQTNIPYVSAGNIVYNIYEDSSGVLWYGGDFGLVRKDRKKGTKDHFGNHPNDPLSLNSTIVVSIYEDKQGVLWIGTNIGLNRFNKKNRSFTRYKSSLQTNRSDPYLSIEDIYEDRSGNFWIGTGDYGLKRMDRQTGAVLHYPYNRADSNSISTRRVRRIYEDRNRNLWIGTLGGGLNRLTNTRKPQHFLYRADINDILEDFEGVLWVATSNGLYRKDQQSNSFEHFVYPGTQMTSDIVISGLLEDDQRALWLNSSIGILKLSRDRDALVIYGERHGVNAETRRGFVDAGCYKSKTGELFFGDGNGYYSFFPAQLSRNNRPPQILINQLRLGDEIIKPSKKGPLKKPLSATGEIRLQHNQDFFSFDFAGIHYSDPKENRHLFMLEGLDENWHIGDQKTAYYSKVPPGRYVFRVKASNSDGVWAEKSIAVIVLPPWWRMWWFVTIVAVFIIASVYVLMRWRIQQKFRVQLEGSKNEKQLAELQQQKTELEMQALRAQMNPHFIFNSLNSINRFILQNNREQASEYLTKFSRLMRLILQNSQVVLTTLETELETLRLYLELEALRFDDRFSFKIIVNDELDAQIIKMPPLIIQPFAENAIWHGLMHKEEKGNLQVELFQQDEMLCCKITDDGIGRKKAEDLRNKSASIHKSIGLRITEERIAILQQQKHMQSCVQITDLVLPDGTAGGTEVLLKIPLIIN